MASESSDFFSEDTKQRRRLRSSARARLWTASSLHSVRTCGRVVRPDSKAKGRSHVEILRGDRGKGGVGGLVTCGSPWACPTCSAVTAMSRSIEIANAAETCLQMGGDLALLTLTLQHDAKDSLEHLWDGLASGWREVFGSNKWTGTKARRRADRTGKTRVVPEELGEKELYSIAGTVRVVESSYGSPEEGGHGWHLHAHVLLFSTAPWHQVFDDSYCAEKLLKETTTTDERELITLSSLAIRIFARWRRGVLKAGLPAPRTEGFDLRRVTDTSEFVAKYLSKSTLDVAAKVGAEMGSGVNTKLTRKLGNRVPFEILLDAIEEHPSWWVKVPRNWDWSVAIDGTHQVIDRDSGEIQPVRAPRDWSLWYQWEQASSGKRQVLWSQRVANPSRDREYLWNEILNSREGEKTPYRTPVVGMIHRDDWVFHLSTNPDAINQLLELVDQAENELAAKDAILDWAKDKPFRFLPASDGEGF